MLLLLIVLAQSLAIMHYRRSIVNSPTSSMAMPRQPAIPASTLPLDEQLTIVIMTYQRVSVLLESLIFVDLVPLDIVHELVIVWNDVANRTGIDALQDHFENLGIQYRIRFYFPSSNSLNNRFMVPDIQTDCVFNIDDEWTMTATNFRAGFKLWQRAPYRLVGQLPRLIQYEKHTREVFYMGK